MILSTIEHVFRPILSRYTDTPEKFLGMISRCADAKFGDYQANFAMPLGKILGEKPRDTAQKILNDVCENPLAEKMFEKIDVAGPGFLNLTLRAEWVAEQLECAARDERLGVPSAADPKTYVIDYSSPNVAKPMHVGHIRSTIIGDSVCRTLRFLGHHVVSDNHLGDWGTQFGMIFYGWKHYLDEKKFEENPIMELLRLYRIAREEMDSNESVADECRRETERLHAGDPENLALWNRIMPHCLAEIDRAYARLDISFDETHGESFYNDRLPGVVQLLKEKGLAVESNGAVCVFFEGRETPMIVQKKDGAYLYATTDLATFFYRMENFNPDAILYVVDHRQSEHFQMLFKTIRMLGYEDVDLRHVSFGTILGEDRTPFKTRSGETVGLDGLLDEAVERARAAILQNPTTTIAPEDLDETSRRIGIGALKYADLSQNRESDYIFSYDKMLSLNGNTAAYMQYAYARVRSIFSRGGFDPNEVASSSKIVLTHPAERALAIELLRFGEALEGVAKDFRPNFLSSYLYELANRYSSFFENCPVLRAEEDAVRDSRLTLCDLTARTIQKGLGLLGIQTVEKM
ncbi:MAG: arginine--tRNA ligase [Planctomycetia bacterium]|nr:arginine--tRNA ligase [Planctomycetia bacterium]